MEAPKCPFCGVKEWRHVCGRIAGGDVKKGFGEGGAGSGKGADTWGVSGEVPQKQEGKTGVDSPKSGNGRSRETYNAYMREYMKRRRSKNTL